MPTTIAPPAGGYTSQFLLDACAAAVGGTVILDREAARAWVKSVRTPRTSLPRVGQSFFHVLPQSHPSRHDGLILDAMPGGVIHCRLITPPRRPGWKVIPAAMWVRDDGATASIYGSAPWTSEAERAR